MYHDSLNKYKDSFVEKGDELHKNINKMFMTTSLTTWHHFKMTSSPSCGKITAATSKQT